MDDFKIEAKKLGALEVSKKLIAKIEADDSAFTVLEKIQLNVREYLEELEKSND